MQKLFPFFTVYPLSYCICTCSFFSNLCIYVLDIWYVQRSSRGKSGRLIAKGSLVRIPLEQFLLKTRAVNSVIGNRNMIGKFPTWWENSVRGKRKTARKNTAMVENFPQWEKKSPPLHGSFSTAAPVLYVGIYLPLFSQCRPSSVNF